jgi:serine/threonine protein kinase
VREFARGEELSKWRGKGVAGAEVRRRLARDIAAIVEHLHERGYLLLDLRPANFFVEPASMTPMLIDVGHCKPMTNGAVDLGVPPKGKAHGSPGFAAPETLQGTATPRTDVWGFGRLYFFMATGQLPKQAMTTADLLAKMPEDAIDRRVVERCASDEVDARPATMREAAKLLG